MENETLINDEKLKNDTQYLAAVIEKTLAAPPCAAGVKLRSDREIARSLKISPSRVRSSMELLEKKGYILRKHGSGTYVRRMAKSTPKYKNLKSLSPSKIFKGYAKSSDKFDQPDINIKLSFSLWGDLQFTSFASQQLYAAITSYINELGHDVKINSIFRNYRDPLPIEQVTEKLRSSVDVCDGYIVIANVANIFDRAKKGLDISTVYFAAGNLPVYEPMVMFDTGEAVERAFRIFARQGYKKIALLALASSELYTKPEKSIYLKEIEQHDFSYSNIIQIPQPPTIGATMNAVREALDSKEPPEAIYIADDNFMPAVIEVLNSKGIKPGRDIAIITLSNKGIALPQGHNWSRLEFHPDELAKEVMNKLLARVLRGERTPPSTTILARFVNGDTHIIK